MDRVQMSFFVSFLIAVILIPILIPILKGLKFGQTIREIGPSWHKSKNGTPTMGGIGFLVSVAVSTLIFAFGDQKVGLALLTVIGFGVLGFADDFIKVVLKRNLGLTEIQKLFFQVLISVLFIFFAYKNGFVDTALKIPFTSFSLELKWFYFVFTAFLMVGFVNAVNLTDGVDGLAASVTAVVGLFFTIVALREEQTSLAVLPSAVVGGLVAFLFFNFNPAKVFMGDTGSLFLGGVVSVMAVLLDCELLLLLAGFIYLAEALSVMIQVAYFKKTGKRVFLMTPIHHHFEKKNWKEKKIVLVFTAVTLVCCLIGYFA